MFTMCSVSVCDSCLSAQALPSQSWHFLKDELLDNSQIHMFLVFLHPVVFVTSSFLFINTFLYTQGSEHKTGSIGRTLFWPEMISRIISPHWMLVSQVCFREIQAGSSGTRAASSNTPGTKPWGQSEETRMSSRLY